MDPRASPIPIKPSYKSDEVLRYAGIGPATLKSWHRLNVVPRPPFRGPATTYPRELFLRVLAAVTLRNGGLRPSAVRARLASMSAQDIAALLGDEIAPPPAAVAAERVLARTAAAPAAPTLPTRAWERVTLVPGLEVWFDAQGPAALRRLAAEIYRQYGSSWVEA